MSDPPRPELSLKSKYGIGLAITGMIFPVFALAVPLFNYDAVTSAALVTFCLVGGPEIFLIAGGLLAGKEGVLLVKNGFKQVFKRCVRLFKKDAEPPS